MTVFNNSYNQEIELTDEQERCLNYHLGDKTLMIKGYAGAGKSVVLQTAALKYVNMYPVGKRDHKIGVFTYTNALTTTTRELLDANLGGGDVYTSTLDKYIIDVYKSMGGPKKKMFWGKIREDNIRLALEMHERAKGAHRFHKLPVKFWEEEIDWMKRMNVSVDDRDYYLTLPRRGRGSGIRMSPADRVAAFEIFCTYCQVNDSKGYGDWSDYPIYINKRLIEYETAKEAGKPVHYPIPDDKLFDMILIDEAQDLSLSQMFVAMGLYRKAMVIAMDAHQRIYQANWTPKQVGIETQTQWLKKSMRNTIEIDALAESLRKKNEEYLGADDKEKRAIPVRSGEKPHICGLNSASEEKTFVISQIKQWLSESKDIRIGLIVATNNQVEKYSSWCSDAGIYHEIINRESTFSMKTPGLKILNAYNAKGLEFFRVIIPEFNEGYFPFRIKEDDSDDKELLLVQFRSLAYVAMTRAQESLVISYVKDKESRFIGEMDSKLYTHTYTTRSVVVDKRSSYVRINTATSSRTNSSGRSTKVSGTSVTQSKKSGKDLISFFQGKGFTCVDKRASSGGCLWVIGSKAELTPVISEAKRIFGDLGNNGFSEHGGRATERQPAWYIRADK